MWQQFFEKRSGNTKPERARKKRFNAFSATPHWRLIGFIDIWEILEDSQSISTHNTTVRYIQDSKTKRQEVLWCYGV
jgi:hypothetical protein